MPAMPAVATDPQPCPVKMCQRIQGFGGGIFIKSRLPGPPHAQVPTGINLPLLGLAFQQMPRL